MKSIKTIRDFSKPRTKKINYRESKDLENKEIINNPKTLIAKNITKHKVRVNR